MMSERAEALREAAAALRRADGIGSWQEAVAVVEALLVEGGGPDEVERGLLAANDGFCDMVVREAEAMIIHAPMDDLVVFAYGDWAAAREAWRRLRRGEYRRRHRRPAA